MSGSIDILNVRVNPISQNELINRVIEGIRTNGKYLFTYANIHAVNLAQEHLWFRDILNRSTLTYCDGYGLWLGAAILGYKLPGRFTPPDWFPHLARLCAENGYSVFLVGSQPGIADAAGYSLESIAPGIHICGTWHGFFDKDPSSEENNHLISTIEVARPNLLVVGMGMPVQEKWIAANWDRLHCGSIITVGAMLDYLAGRVVRPPQWMTDHGFEWLGRLFYEPRRLWSRYLIGGPLFFFRILRLKVMG